MSVVAAAVVGSALVGAYSSNKASKAQQKSAKEGAEAEKEMADQNIAFQREMAMQQREDFAPWRDIGQQALQQIWEGVQTGAFDPGRFDASQFDLSKMDVEIDPGYAFRLKQGQEALDSSAAARGRLLSGAQLKALTGYGQEMGSQEYANAYARALNKNQIGYQRYVDQYAMEADRKRQNFNLLSGLSQGGQASAAGQAQASSQLAQTGGNILANTGIAQNAAIQQAGAARAGGYQDQGRIVNQAAQNWLTYNAMNSGG